jgi:hypothetical protein
MQFGDGYYSIDLLETGEFIKARVNESWYFGYVLNLMFNSKNVLPFDKRTWSLGVQTQPTTSCFQHNTVALLQLCHMNELQ